MMEVLEMLPGEVRQPIYARRSAAMDGMDAAIEAGDLVRV
jgi:hypothetical protein